MDRILRFLARLVAAITACLALPAAAGEPIPQTAAASVAAAPEVNRPALWKLSDEDTTIYLFGTIHALPSGLSWFDGAVEDAFDQSQELVTEIVGDNPGEMQSLVIDKAMLPEGETLRSLMSDGERVRYESAMQTLGLPAQAFDAFEPWYAAVGLSTLPLLRDGYARDNGVDQALEVRAKVRGLQHGALETADYQLGLFDSLPLDVQTHYLAEVVDNLPTMKSDLDKMIVAWKTGDAEGLAKLINSEEDDPVLVETLLVNRNRNWAGWISERMAKPGTVFLAVGAGHLAGEGSVQDQLASRGLSIVRVQ